MVKRSLYLDNLGMPRLVTAVSVCIADPPSREKSLRPLARRLCHSHARPRDKSIVSQARLRATIAPSRAPRSQHIQRKRFVAISHPHVWVSDTHVLRNFYRRIGLARTCGNQSFASLIVVCLPPYAKAFITKNGGISMSLHECVSTFGLAMQLSSFGIAKGVVEALYSHALGSVTPRP